MPKDNEIKQEETNNDVEQNQPEPKPEDQAEPAGNGEDQKAEEKVDTHIVDKLKARLTKEQAGKNEYKDKYESLKKELDKLKEDKSVKDIHEEDKNQKELAERDKTIKELQAKIKRSETLKQVDSIFKENDLSVSDDILNLVVSDDSEQTVSNANAIINLINTSYEDGRKTILKGSTPKASGHKPQGTKSLNDMTLLERVQLKNEDPEAYNELVKKSGY